MNNIKRWKNIGLIDENLALVLEEDLKKESKKRAKFLTQITLYTIGVILVAIGVICFISANDWIVELFKKTPLIQTFVLFVFAISSLYFGVKFKYENKNFPKLGTSLIFLSTLLIGAAYIQIGQMYNWYSNASSVLFLWFISVFPLTFIFKSQAINILSTILFVFVFPCFYYDLGIDKCEVWTIFMPFSLCGILYTFANIPVIQNKFNNFSTVYKITALLSSFFTFLILIFSINHSYQLINPYYIIIPLILIIVNMLNYNFDKNALKKIETYFMVFLMIFLLVLLTVPMVNPFVANIISHLFLIFIISSLFHWGYKFEKTSLVNLSNLFLLIYILCIYSRYGWSYIDKTLFFLLGGIILLAVGVYLEKGKNKWLKNQNPEEK